MGTNFYINQLINYNQNYDEAINSIDSLYSKIDDLYMVFNKSTGKEVKKVILDLTYLLDYINNIKTTIDSKQKATNNRANSCYNCYKRYCNKSYPDEVVGKKHYFPNADVTINQNTGLITVRRYYILEKDFWDNVKEFFLRSAGERSESYTVPITEMFND